MIANMMILFVRNFCKIILFLLMIFPIPMKSTFWRLPWAFLSLQWFLIYVFWFNLLRTFNFNFLILWSFLSTNQVLQPKRQINHWKWWLKFVRSFSYHWGVTFWVVYSFMLRTWFQQKVNHFPFWSQVSFALKIGRFP